MEVETTRRSVPKLVRENPRLGERIKWARTSAGLSHDRLIELLGRSNRGHLIKIEKGIHAPGPDLRDAIADATRVPRGLFATEEVASSGERFRNAGADVRRASRKGGGETGGSGSSGPDVKDAA